MGGRGHCPGEKKRKDKTRPVLLKSDDEQREEGDWCNREREMMLVRIVYWGQMGSERWAQTAMLASGIKTRKGGP